MQVGIDSFAAAFDVNGRAVNPAEWLRQLVQQIEHADEVGLDVFGVGEHHRREFLDSAPAVILGAAAARAQHIRLTSAVTVLSAEDPTTFGAVPSVETALRLTRTSCNTRIVSWGS
jgi:alkanesulfonate monooxygenase SsuD/methylene tetrahydromethanopterin reductase-like flavin-dependent oxidoreductase (luciferase family)